ICIDCVLDLYLFVFCFFFFSSRRRHTRSKRDWSSDVCSSDLKIHDIVIANWISTTGMAALVVNEIASFSQTQIVNVLNAQIHDAMLNNRLSETQENPMFAADEEASLKDNLA